MIVGSLPMFEAVFGEIGYVFQINVPEDQLDLVLQNVTNIMINSDICTQNCTGSEMDFGFPISILLNPQKTLG